MNNTYYTRGRTHAHTHHVPTHAYTHTHTLHVGMLVEIFKEYKFS